MSNNNNQPIPPEVQELFDAINERFPLIDTSSDKDLRLYNAQHKLRHALVSGSLALRSPSEGQGMKFFLGTTLEGEPDSLQQLVIDYMTFLELDEIGEIGPEPNFTIASPNHVFSCLRRAMEKANQRPAKLLLNLLSRRVKELPVQEEAKAEEWISVDADPPPYATIVDGYSSKWVDEDYNPDGVRECFLGNSEWFSAVWNNEQDCFDTDGSKPTHWRRKPAPPQTKNKE